MSTVFSFQAQLVSIMDALSKTAVLEISKLVEIESKMLKIEITRGRNEIASLTEKLQLMEKLLCLAQGGRLDAAAAAAAAAAATAAAAAATAAAGTVCRDAPENGVLEPDRTRPAIKSEIPWENTDSFTEPSSLPQSEEPAAELQNPSKEQPGLIMVKEEPSDMDDANGEQDRMCLNAGQEAVVESQRHPDVMQPPKPPAEHQQPLFADRFGASSTAAPLATAPLVALQRRETHWSPQLAAAAQASDLEAGKSIAQHVASQSLIVLRNMKLHNLKSAAAKRFGCLQCGKSFRCFSQLEIHQRSHTGEKPFRCTLCGKRYAQKGHLYTHQRTHTGEKPYRCPICGKGFIQKCTLDMHQRTHTGEKPFVCGKCGKGFTKNCNLKKHLTLHLDPSLNLYSNDIGAPTFSGMYLNGGT